MTVIFITADGKKVCREAITAAVVSAGNTARTVRFSDLNRVDYVLQVNLTTSPPTYATHHGVKITDNVVGLTLYAGAGTTLGGEVIAEGV